MSITANPVQVQLRPFLGRKSDHSAQSGWAVASVDMLEPSNQTLLGQGFGMFNELLEWACSNRGVRKVLAFVSPRLTNSLSHVPTPETSR